MTNRPLRVFLCHSSNDKPAVRELYQKLRAEPWIQPWLDEEELYPGQDWNLEIEKAVEAADAIIVCLSKGSITKEGYVQKEIKTALDFSDYKPEGTVFIIPVRLEDCKPPNRLSKWQYADYFEGQRERGTQRLIISLRRRADLLGLRIEIPSVNLNETLATKKEEEETIDNLINPYIAGAPVTEPSMFFGREDVFQWIQNNLSGQYTDHILVISGQRRIGKTSVLKQLSNHLPQRYIPIFFDLQGRTHTTLDRFMWWLSREIVRTLKQDRNIKFYIPEKEAFSSDIEYFEKIFLPYLMPVLGDKSLLLTFDEFENLEESDVKETLAHSLLDYLRRLMENQKLNFIFSVGASGRRLENMQATFTEFFKVALYKRIGFLNEEQTHHLIVRPAENIIEYAENAIARIYQITGGHPYFTQLICRELYTKCQITGERCIQESDVESVLEGVVERGTVNLKFVWDEASNIEKWCLVALTQIQEKPNIQALSDYLRKHRVRFNESELDSGLLHLREKDVLTQDNRFIIYLMNLWLQKNRPVEQVREELTEVNPIANHYIEIGLEYKNSRLHEKAIESFKAALEIDSDNLQAQINLAQVYLDQKNIEKAIVEFEKALLIDEEDIATLMGLCDAYLAQGDQARANARPDDAILFYQKILAINGGHNEACQRMAEINCQRAEKALVDNKDEEALSAFAESLKYTPEDPSLIARVEQVKAEIKAKLSATQISNPPRIF